MRALYVLFVLLAALGAPSVAFAQAWWDDDWAHRQELVLTDAAGALTTAVDDLPLLVRLDATRIPYEQTQAGGGDLRFVLDDDGTFTVLPHEIERWDPPGEGGEGDRARASIVWVHLPTFDPAAPGSVWMYWGNDTPGVAPDPTKVWGAYDLVWHLDGTAESSGYSGSGNPTLTPNGGPTPIEGALGGAYTLDGTNDYFAQTVALGGSGLLGGTGATLEFWVRRKASDTGSSGASAWTARGITGAEDGSTGAHQFHDDVFWGWIDDTGKVGVSFSNHTAAKVTPVTDTWHHVVLVREDDGRVSAYLDGAASATSVGNASGNAAHAFTDIGRILNSSNPYFQGDLDEIRVRGVRTGAAFVAASYRSQSDHLIDWCDPEDPPTWYTDADGDGYGDPATAVATCVRPTAGVSNGDDCDDTNPLLNPATLWYLDADYDGYGNDLGVVHDGEGVADACEDPSDSTCENPDPSGVCYVLDADDCDDDNPLVWESCETCADGDSDGAWFGCDAYGEQGEDCDDANPYVWDTCGTCVDGDSDGAFVGCNDYDPLIGEDCDDANPMVWASCSTCADEDGDGRFVGCDAYPGDSGPDACDDVGSNPLAASNWTASGCATCADVDGDGRYAGCDAYVLIDIDHCDDAHSPTGPYNWTETGCTDCADLDGDGRYDGCDSYDPTALPQDFCERDDPVGQNHWSSDCADCADADADGFHVGCDQFVDPFLEDCDDTDPQINPNTVWYVDGDCDGDGSSVAYNGGAPQCADPSEPPTCYAPNDLDCDDGDADLNTETTWYEDRDGDGYGGMAPEQIANQCDAPTGAHPWIRRGGDCDDIDPEINPETWWYLDSDDDGQGSQDPADATQSCEQPVDHVRTNEDCDDGDGTRWVRDSDGIPFLYEQWAGSSDCTDDSDDDTVSDLDEWVFETSGPPCDLSDVDGVLVPTVLGDPDCVLLDTDGNGVPNLLDDDDDGDNVPTRMEDYTGGENGWPDGDPTNDDSDGDGTPDYLDDDDDGDTILTKDEDLDGDGDPTNDDFDLDLIPNYLDPDDDNDGILTKWEVAVDANPYSRDSDGDGVPDRTEWGDLTSSIPQNFDGDAWPDIIDPDDDNDGIPTLFESRADLDGDENCIIVGDGEPSYRDIDSDGDGYCDGFYEPVGDECLQWLGVVRDPDAGEQIPETLQDDYDGDGIPNVYDCDDLDYGEADYDGDGLTNAQEGLVPCVILDEIEYCIDPFDPDTDGDGVLDGLEVGPDPLNPRDTDGDGIPDWLDLDDDGDGVPTLDEDYSDGQGGPPDGDPTNDDTDGDGTPDYLDFDDDGDGYLTIEEDWNGNGDPRDDDIDGDGLADYLDDDHHDGPLGDLDRDGIPNWIEAANGLDPRNPDSDFDGVPDGLEFEDALGNRLDTDGDGVLDALDPDDDGDGIPTWVEGQWDADGDGVPNYLDLNSDGDDMGDDRVEGGDAWEAGLPLPDTDGDGIPDFLDPVHDHLASLDDWTPNPNLDMPGCACAATPGPNGGALALGLLALVVGLRRRRAA